MNLSEEIRDSLRAQKIEEKRDLLVKFTKIEATVRHAIMAFMLQVQLKMCSHVGQMCTTVVTVGWLCCCTYLANSAGHDGKGGVV